MKRLLKSPKRAVVSGLSISGMVAAWTLAKSGWDIVAYESRHHYNRNVHFGARQAFLDVLTGLDRNMAIEVLEASSTLPLGAEYVTDTMVEYFRGQAPVIREMLEDEVQFVNEGPCMLVKCRIVEEILFRRLRHVPNVRIVRAASRLVRNSDSDTYSVAEATGPRPQFDRPDLVVICEGASSHNLSITGITRTPVGGTQFYVAAETGIGCSTGKMSIRLIPGEPIIGCMAMAGRERTWVLAQVPASSLDYQSSARCFNAMLTNATYKILDLPRGRDLETFGAIEGSVPGPFKMQQFRSSAAVAGQNVVLLGDTVGSGHWGAGAGMQIASVAHMSALRQLISREEISSGLHAYESSVFQATDRWLTSGSRFYDAPPCQL